MAVTGHLWNVRGWRRHTLSANGPPSDAGIPGHNCAGAVWAYLGFARLAAMSGKAVAAAFRQVPMRVDLARVLGAGH